MSIQSSSCLAGFSGEFGRRPSFLARDVLLQLIDLLDDAVVGQRLAMELFRG